MEKTVKKLLVASMLTLCPGITTASAQTRTTPAETAPATAPDASAGGSAGVGAAPAERPNNSSETGPDKINGLEVPKMKDGRDGGRE